VGRATFTIVVSRLIASTAKHSVKRIAMRRRFWDTGLATRTPFGPLYTARSSVPTCRADRSTTRGARCARDVLNEPTVDGESFSSARSRVRMSYISSTVEESMSATRRARRRGTARPSAYLRPGRERLQRHDFVSDRCLPCTADVDVGGASGWRQHLRHE